MGGLNCIVLVEAEVVLGADEHRVEVSEVGWLGAHRACRSRGGARCRCAPGRKGRLARCRPSSGRFSRTGPGGNPASTTTTGIGPIVKSFFLSDHCLALSTQSLMLWRFGWGDSVRWRNLIKSCCKQKSWCSCESVSYSLMTATSFETSFSYFCDSLELFGHMFVVVPCGTCTQPSDPLCLLQYLNIFFPSRCSGLRFVWFQEMRCTLISIQNQMGIYCAHSFPNISQIYDL